MLRRKQRIMLETNGRTIGFVKRSEFDLRGWLADLERATEPSACAAQLLKADVVEVLARWSRLLVSHQWQSVDRQTLAFIDEVNQVRVALQSSNSTIPQLLIEEIACSMASGFGLQTSQPCTAMLTLSAMYVDSHCHLNYLKSSLGRVGAGALQVGWAVCSALVWTKAGIDEVLAVAKANDDVWASVGLHPQAPNKTSVG